MERCRIKWPNIWRMRSRETPGFPWRTRRFHLCARLATMNRTRRVPGWRRPNFIAGGRLNWIRICRKDTSPALFCYGARRRTSNTWKRLPNSSERWRCRTINRTPTTVWVQSWRTLACSTTLVKCMSGRGHLIRKKQSVTASCKCTSGTKNTIWRGRRFRLGAPRIRTTSIRSILLRRWP